MQLCSVIEFYCLYDSFLVRMRISLCVVWFKDIFRVRTDQLKTPYGLKQNKQKRDNAEDRTELEPSIYRAGFGMTLGFL